MLQISKWIFIIYVLKQMRANLVLFKFFKNWIEEKVQKIFTFLNKSDKIDLLSRKNKYYVIELCGASK